MLTAYQTKITQIGNSKGVRLPKEFVLSLGTTDVVLEQTDNGILIKPAPAVPPLEEWPALFASASKQPEKEFDDWDITLNDGLTHD